MNVEKDQTIMDFMDRLAKQINMDDIEMVDYWDGDLCAMGFKIEHKVVYVSTWNMVSRSYLGYYYSFEYYIDFLDEIHTIEEHEDVAEEVLIAGIKRFLELE